MGIQVEKMRRICLGLILILNLHMICADTIFHNLANGMTGAVSDIYGRLQNDVWPEKSRNSSYASQTPVETIIQDNYPGEAHQVVTEDGYVLTVYRIRGAPGSTPVLLQHGLLESSADWLIPGRGRSLAYILADQGYDVWLGNARGNTYSRKHLTLSTSDPKFWNFTWQELGMYDLPALINYITDLTQERLFYVGHSMGATTFSVMAMERPEVATKVKAMFGLAPATYVHYIKAPIKKLSYIWRQVQGLANALGLYQLLPRSTFFNYFSNYVCNTMLLRNAFCGNLLFLIGGFSTGQLDYTLLPKIWSKFPAGTSMKLFIHWLQQMTVDKLLKFDYGPETNFKLYKSVTPTEYDLSKVKVPVAVFWGESDWLVGQKDVEHFYNEVPLKMGLFKVDNENFNHFDFLWGIDAPKLVYAKMMELMSEVNNQIFRN